MYIHNTYQHIKKNRIQTTSAIYKNITNPPKK